MLHSAVNQTPPLAIPTRKDRHLHSILHSARAALRLHPPTHKRTDERTEFRLWHSLSFIAEGRYADGSIFNPTRHNVAHWLYTAQSILRSAPPVIAKSEHRCSRPRFAYGCEHRPLRLGEAIDCSLRLHYAFRRHHSCVGVLARSIAPTLSNYL